MIVPARVEACRAGVAPLVRQLATALMAVRDPHLTGQDLAGTVQDTLDEIASHFAATGDAGFADQLAAVTLEQTLLLSHAITALAAITGLAPWDLWAGILAAVDNAQAGIDDDQPTS